MKTKLYKILGVALTLVLLASLTVGLTTVPTGAASSNLKWVKLELPKVENFTDNVTFAAPEGDYWATPGIDPGPIAITPDGDLLFAAVTDNVTIFDVLKSSDGGYSWSVTGFSARWWDMDPGTAGFQTDGSPVVDMVTSPEYVDDTTMVVATQNYVYISEDGAKTFTVLNSPWFGSGTINDVDMTCAEDGDLSLMVATTEPEVYVTSGLLAWTAQGIPTDFPNATSALACAFLPTFADDGDIGICAIVTDNATVNITNMTFSFADISVGGEWGDAIKDATFANADLNVFGSESACIAFPEDFDAFGTGNNVCFAGVVQTGDLGKTSLSVSPASGSDAYQVICKEGGSSTAVDLDVRGVLTTLAPTATAITSIEVCGNAEEATILVGTDAINMGDAPEYFPTYLSEDSGESWTPSGKCVTGGTQVSEINFSSVNTQVLMAPDFCSGSTAYASTQGSGTSAFHRTTDSNGSWNQISIIDYGSGTAGYSIVPVTGFSAYGYCSDDTLWAITQVSSTVGAFWGRLDGNHWERLWSYANPGVTNTLARIDILGDGSAMFVSDLTNEKIYRSTDMGATFPKTISTKSPLTTVAPVSATTLYTGSVGQIWWSTRSGTGWTKPDNSDIPAGAVIASLSVAGDIVLVGATGGVYISSDGGENVEKVGTDSPFTGMTAATSDLGFGDNGILYATDPVTPSANVMRTEVDLDSPHDAEWIKLDNFQDSTDSAGAIYYPDTTFRAGGPALALPLNGILYVIDAMTVLSDYNPATIPTNAGGLWRCVNPTAETTSPAPPYFERETNGLTDNVDSLGLAGLDMNPANNMQPTIFALNSGAVPYYQQIVLFTDILNVGVTLVTPEADATGVGLLPENTTGDVFPVVTFGWEEMAGATWYQYQVSIDPDFKTRVLDGYTNTLGLIVDSTLLANGTYYWRVRVAKSGSLIGAPLISPWSATYKFKTVIGPSMQRPVLQAPSAGEEGVPLSPTFEWSGIEWAEEYEFELALDPTTTAGNYFTEPLVALVGADALVSTAWKCDITLDYSTRYYWHVKALGVDTDTPWSDVGTFTTMDVPAEPTTEAPPITIPPTQEITPAWIWAVVIIGAILVIAVIVLIVTTRRVP